MQREKEKYIYKMGKLSSLKFLNSFCKIYDGKANTLKSFLNFSIYKLRKLALKILVLFFNESFKVLAFSVYILLKLSVQQITCWKSVCLGNDSVGSVLGKYQLGNCLVKELSTQAKDSRQHSYKDQRKGILNFY